MDGQASLASPSEQEGWGKKFEILTAITLAFFAAILAITDLAAGRYGDDEIMGTSERANIYSWYQSKSVKESLLEGQRDLVKTLLDSGAIRKDEITLLENLLIHWDKDIERYKREKKELLLGSSVVGPENWVQEVDGELGKVVGAKEWEKKLDTLGRAGDRFDLAALFLQLSLVIGAVSLVLQAKAMKWTFWGIMTLLGSMGSFYSICGFMIALKV